MMKPRLLLLLTLALASTLLACGADEEPVAGGQDPTSPASAANPTAPVTNPSGGAAPAEPPAASPDAPATGPATDPGTTPKDPNAPVDPKSTDPMAPPSAPSAPAFPTAPIGGGAPEWFPVGTFQYAGFSQVFPVALPTTTITHFLLEAPSYCAPRLVQAYTATLPNGALLPVWFEGQRVVFPSTIQALLRIGNGLPVSSTQLTLGFTSATGAPCPITVYAHH